MPRGWSGRLRGRGRTRSRPGAPRDERRQRGIPARATSDGEESSRRPAETIAALRKVRNQLAGDIDLGGRLPGAGAELPHGLPGLIARLAVDAALKALEPPKFGLRLPDLLGRIGPRDCRRIGHLRLAWLDCPSTRVRSILCELDGAARTDRARRQRALRHRHRDRSRRGADVALHRQTPLPEIRVCRRNTLGKL